MRAAFFAEHDARERAGKAFCVTCRAANAFGPADHCEDRCIYLPHFLKNLDNE
jgi:hypothetical protein